MRDATYFEIVLLLFDYYERYRIEGDSMLPTLKNGDEVLVSRGAKFAVGDIVVANHPYQSIEIVKRISAISETGVFLLGDNPPESADSRKFGEISTKNILGTVIARL